MLARGASASFPDVLKGNMFHLSHESNKALSDVRLDHVHTFASPEPCGGGGGAPEETFQTELTFHTVNIPNEGPGGSGGSAGL